MSQFYEHYLFVLSGRNLIVVINPTMQLMSLAKLFEDLYLKTPQKTHQNRKVYFILSLWGFCLPAFICGFFAKVRG